MMILQLAVAWVAALVSSGVAEKTPPFEDATFELIPMEGMDKFRQYKWVNTFEKGSKQTGAQDNEVERTVAVIFGGVEEGIAWFVFIGLFLLCHCLFCVICCSGIGINLVRKERDGSRNPWGFLFLFVAAVPVLGFLCAVVGVAVAVVLAVLFFIVFVILVMAVGGLWLGVFLAFGWALLWS
eukprot:2158270-Amphidinium_carterae.1